MRRGGRLFLLLGLIIAALGAFLAYYFFSLPNQSANGVISQPTTVPLKNVVVARIDIPVNTVLTETETYLTTKDIRETEYNANPRNYFTTVSELQGKLALRQIAADAAIRPADVVDPGLSFQIPPPPAGQPAYKALVLQVNNLTGVADQIKPGDAVDVLSTFIIRQVFVRPGINDQGTPTSREEEQNNPSTKTLVQSVPVLQVRRVRQEAQGTPTPGRAAPTPAQTDDQGRPVQPGQTPGTGATGPDTQSPDTYTPGSWLVLIAVTDQQAEAIKFAQEQGTGLTLVLRGRGDTAVETTFGATLDILISRFGVPIPNTLPPAQLSGGLPAQPGISTTVPVAATPGATPTPRP